MNLEEFYHEVDGDYQKAISYLNSDALILRYLSVFQADPVFEQFESALAREDQAEAFRMIHNLKGASAMFGLEKLAQLSSEMTEQMRFGKMPKSPASYDELRQVYYHTIEMIRQIDTDENK